MIDFDEELNLETAAPSEIIYMHTEKVLLDDPVSAVPPHENSTPRFQQTCEEELQTLASAFIQSSR